MISAIGLSSVSPLPLSADRAKPAVTASAPNLLDAWEQTQRGMQEKILAERLDTVEKIANALTPLMVNATTGASSRALASTLSFLGRETQDIVRQMDGELKRQGATAAAGKGAVSSGFHDLIGKAEWSLQRVSGMLLAVGESDEKPLPGRLTAREIANEGAKPLLAAWGALGDLRARYAGMGIFRVDVRA